MIDLAQGRILVTGGAGFIGSALVWELNRRGFQNILIADFLGETEKWKNLAPLRFVDYLEADSLLDLVKESSYLLSDIRTIFHLGACSSTTETDAAYLIHNNYEYSKTLAHFALESGRRYVYASSAATYGARESGLSENLPLSRLRPLNMYAYSKHLFDCYAESINMLGRITGIKYFNVYGPNENHKGEMRSVVNKAFNQIGNTGRVSLFKSYRPDYPDGAQRRDFLYVMDAVAATVFLAEQVDGGGLFNVGSGEAHTWLELAHAIFIAMGKEQRIDFIDMPEQLRGRYQYFTRADIAKLRAAGFTQSFTPLRKGVSDYVQAYLQPDLHLGD
ncbi:MAG TPA: ADP-glyceromanno-heptose 6-epimerase [Bryobacteraceae bacterium]|jgi:ADP-L-glycero-D-manno-heptose 6-epimerase|nr:ADP-glyceromanno-heptose 6-epimerase [Bryobacteraceae bacterium]